MGGSSNLLGKDFRLSLPQDGEEFEYKEMKEGKEEL